MSCAPRLWCPFERPSWLVLTGALVMAMNTACGDGPTRSSLNRPVSPMLSFAGVNCGATFTMTVVEDDPLMVQYGIPTSTDTVEVCETWTGSDYDVRTRTVGSSENLPDFTDEVQHADYLGGSVTGYDQNGVVTATPSSVGSTAFDFVNADDATQQASYDDPYYGIYSGGGGGGGSCVDPNDPDCPPAQTSRTRSASASIAVSARQFPKHGLSRRGVRALVDDADEITPPSPGRRRFRKLRGDEEVLLTLDRTTELLVEEEHRSSRGRMVVKHSWRKTGNGYVREQSDIESTEVIDERTFTSRATLLFSNVRIANP